VERKFKVLRVIGTIWKVLAWLELIIGLVSSLGVLLIGVFGGGILRQFAEQYRQQMPLPPRAFGVTGGIIGFAISVVVTIIYFLMFYAVGELVYLLLAIEENTRQAAQQMQWVQQQLAPPQPAYSPPQPAYSPPPPSAYSPPPPPPPPSEPAPEPPPGSASKPTKRI